MRNFLGFASGGLFGLGLMISGMTDPRKVQGWLDIFGEWDPTLAFVLGGAILPMIVAWRLTEGRRPALGGAFPVPADPVVDRNLVIGSALFGAGWGLVGLCPGPAIASVGYGNWSVWIFVAAMLAGMAVAPRARRSLDGWAMSG